MRERRDESEEKIPAQHFGKQRARHVAAFIGRDNLVISDECRSGEAKENRHDIKENPAL
jgi:hypothetical protein